MDNNNNDIQNLYVNNNTCTSVDKVKDNKNITTKKIKSYTLISSKEKDIIIKLKEKKKKNQKDALKKLIWVSIICIIFIAIEITGSIFSKSDSILSDALHMLSDFYGFGISMFSIYISSKAPTKKLSYGYYRFEVLGALVSVISIWGISAYIFYRAIDKLITREIEVEGGLMLIISIIGLAANILMGHILHSNGGHVRII